MRLRSKVLLLLIPLLLIPVAVLTLLGSRYLVENLRKEHLDGLNSLTHQVQLAAENQLRHAEITFRLLAENPTARQYMVSESVTRYALLERPLLRLTQSLRKAYPGIADIQILLPDGTVDFSVTSGAAVGVLVPYFDRLDPAPDAETRLLIRDGTDKQPRIAFVLASHLTDPAIDSISAEPQFRGFMVMQLSLDFLSRQLSSYEDSESRVLLVDRASGDVLASSRDPEGDQLGTFPVPLLEKSIADTSGEPSLYGDHSLMLVRPLQSGLALVALLDEREIVAPVQRLSLGAWLLTLLAAVISIAVLYLGLDVILLHRLRFLSEQISQVSTNEEIADPADVAGNDELSRVMRSFLSTQHKLRDANATMTQMAFSDGLTGLPNKVALHQAMERALQLAKRRNGLVALMFLDLDNFKNVNDALGHDAGDELLCTVAERLSACVRGYDVVSVGGGAPEREDIFEQPGESVLARLGGDEFSVLLTEINSAQEAGIVAERIIEALALPIKVGAGNEVFVGASIGISMFPHDGSVVESLLKHADIAMYRSKSAGKNTFRFFDSSMNETATERLLLEAEMRVALESGDFELYYQPKVVLKDPNQRQFEALLRWPHATRGMISPGIFIPIAEANGFIRDIGDWVMMEACRQIQAWNDAGYENVHVSINLSSVQINFGTPVESLLKALGVHGIPAGQLEVEVTESGLMKNEEQAIETLQNLKDLGISMALDDFGTGYSSLSYLRNLPIDTLKVDYRFMRDLEHDPESVQVLESIVDLAGKLKLLVVAEGVETAEQLRIVRRLGVDAVQGYYFSKPLHADAAQQFFDGVSGA